ncbi:MAG: hypothetical protein E7423_06070 [Ruminococcaceae bacterium]|nr:hypothetical protein [Oscillospiraceae bacterium]
MKLAEALQERADINRRLAQLQSRIDNNILVQEGETPAEDPAALIRELDGCYARLEHLMAAINRTNAATVVDGMTLTELIARRDALNGRVAAYREIVRMAGQSAYRARNTEIKIKAAVPAAELQKQVDLMAKTLRETDNKLQQANWQVELMEE